MIHSLDRLSEQERDLLTLLAQGHTAKTIARARSLSANVVNEHLRSARRKTGASSSRDLARVVVVGASVAPQEVRDKLIGIEGPAQPEHRRLWTGQALNAGATGINGRVVMTIGVLIAAGALAYLTSAPGQAETAPAAGLPTARVAATSGPADVTYQVLFMVDGEILGAPTVAGRFGQEVQVEFSDIMRVTLFTGERGQDGRFYTSAVMQVFRDNAWQTVREMSMRSKLNFTPSFENTVEGTPYRFVVMPRLIVPAAGHDHGHAGVL
jgi:DNA-binding CsgD family transcriptional regulator